MKKILLTLLLMSSQICYAEKELPEPYCSVVDLPFDPQGWFGNGGQLSVIFHQNKIKTVIEVGSWLGTSTRFFATTMGHHGKVYAIDTWKGSADEELHLSDPRLPYLYQLFLSNIKHANLTHQITPIRMDSLEAAAGLNIKADLIYIDASHDTESVYQDILAWYPHLNDGGIFCGDDWSWPTVRKAVIMAAETLGKSIDSAENFWRYY